MVLIVMIIILSFNSCLFKLSKIIYFKVVFESINFVDFFKNPCGFILYWGTKERQINSVTISCS